VKKPKNCFFTSHFHQVLLFFPRKFFPAFRLWGKNFWAFSAFLTPNQDYKGPTLWALGKISHPEIFAEKSREAYPWPEAFNSHNSNFREFPPGGLKIFPFPQSPGRGAF